jgi:hypothetical protein
LTLYVNGRRTEAESRRWGQRPKHFEGVPDRRRSRSFNQLIDNWNTTAAAMMEGMFEANQPIDD